MVFAGVFGLAVGALSIGSAGASTANFPNDNAQINPGNVPADSTNPSSTGTDCGQGPGQVGWYFVLPPGTANGADTFVTLDLKFQNAGTLTSVSFTHPNGTSNKAVYISNGDDVLLDAGATVSPGPDPSPAQFVLSHICGGGDGNSSSSSSTSESSSSTSESSSSTSESSSSTSESSSSTEASSTSTSSSSSSTEVVVAGSETTASSSSDGTQVEGEALARTGINSGLWAAIGASLVLGGGLILLASRRWSVA